MISKTADFAQELRLELVRLKVMVDGLKTMVEYPTDAQREDFLLASWEADMVMTHFDRLYKVLLFLEEEAEEW